MIIEWKSVFGPQTNSSSIVFPCLQARQKAFCLPHHPDRHKTWNPPSAHRQTGRSPFPPRNDEGLDQLDGPQNEVEEEGQLEPRTSGRRHGRADGGERGSKKRNEGDLQMQEVSGLQHL